MDYLWSPWRYQYIQKALPTDACIFCIAAAHPSDDQANLVIHRGDHNFAMLNRYPYTVGHLLIAPYRHVALIEDASPAALQELMLLTQSAQKHLREAYHPGGYNLGMNLGECAGAGVAGHIHMHVLPRWTGDANFLSTVGETRVLPEDLAATWRKLSAAFANAPG